MLFLYYFPHIFRSLLTLIVFLLISPLQISNIWTSCHAHPQPNSQSQNQNPNNNTNGVPSTRTIYTLLSPILINPTVCSLPVLVLALRRILTFKRVEVGVFWQTTKQRLYLAAVRAFCADPGPGLVWCGMKVFC